MEQGRIKETTCYRDGWLLPEFLAMPVKWVMAKTKERVLKKAL